MNHRCYIQPMQAKKDTPQEEAFEDPMNFNKEEDKIEEKRGPPPLPLLNLADIESFSIDDRVFMPNLICWSTEDDDDIHHAKTIQEFLEAMEKITEVEEDDRPRKVITFFHNMRGFDGHFILEALYEQGQAVEKPLTQGAKILYFESGNLIFKDSIN